MKAARRWTWTAFVAGGFVFFLLMLLFRPRFAAPPRSGPGTELAPPPSPTLKGGNPSAPGNGEPVMTNEELHRRLEEETARLGIRAIAPSPEETAPRGGFLGERLGMPGSRAQVEEALREMAAARAQIEENSGRRKPSYVPGRTARLLSDATAAAGGEIVPDPSSPK